MLPDLDIGFSRGRSGGLVLPSLSEFSTVYCDPHSQISPFFQYAIVIHIFGHSFNRAWYNLLSLGFLSRTLRFIPVTPPLTMYYPMTHSCQFLPLVHNTSQYSDWFKCYCTKLNNHRLKVSDGKVYIRYFLYFCFSTITPIRVPNTLSV